MKKISILCLTLLSFLFSQSQLRYLKGNLQGSQEVPALEVPGSGVVIVKYNMSTKALELFGDYAELTTPISGSHIHIGAPGVSAPPLIDLVNSGSITGTLNLKATLTQAQEDALLAGNMYANVHTETNKGGELRAQLTPTTEGQTTFLAGKFQGAQEVPVTPSQATGAVYALVDMGKDSVYITGSYTSLSAASTNAHVHLENPGTAGAVLFPVYHSSSASGTVHADTVVTAAQADSIIAGSSYVNIHTSTYPPGEIRAQLVNNTTIRYLAGELRGSNERPAPVVSNARGTVIAVYNTETNSLQLAGDYQKLADVVTAAHIHPGDSLSVNPPIIDLTTNPLDSTGTITVITQITDAQELELLAGNMYVNVHSKAFPNGEIRTQLIPTTNGETHLFTVNLTGDQIPVPNSTAAANALIIVDKTTGITYVTGEFSGINSNAISAHIHSGAVGAKGPAIVTLNIVQRFEVPHSGTFSGSDTLSPSLVESMINGLTYIDIHSSFYTGGALRAQLGDLVLPVKLTYLNGYKQKNEIELVWETAEEQNVSRYEIEQLNTTTKDWITKGTVHANGGNSGAKYSYTDIPNTFDDKYLMYRLKIIDKDGRISYSYMVKVNFEKLKAELFIQTNPVTNGELRYNITGLPTGKKAEVSIIDYNGRLILRNVVSSLMNNTLKIPHLSAGMYKLVVRIDGTILQRSFIK